MTCSSTPTDPTALAGSLRIATIRRLFCRLQAARVLYRQRKALALLDDAMLRDIGITREQANSEAKRPVWDVPTHWTRS